MPSRLFATVEDETPLHDIMPKPASAARPVVDMDSVNQSLYHQGYGAYPTGLPMQPPSSPRIRPSNWEMGLSGVHGELGEIDPLPIAHAGHSDADHEGIPTRPMFHPHDSTSYQSRALQESRVILPSSTAQSVGLDDDNGESPLLSTMQTAPLADVGLSQALAESRAMYTNSSTATRWGAKKHKEDNLILELGNEFAPLLDPQGDTLIYVGAPPRVKGQLLSEYAYVEHRFRLLHRVNSQQLKDTGSKVFEKLLGPKSIRTERRLRKEGILDQVHTSGIKYYIDLRPPSEDDEAILLLTELTCTQGVLKWHKSEKKYQISRTMICGRDDFAPLSARLRPLNPNAENSSRKAVLSVQPIEVTNSQPEISALEPEAEYSALRHRSAIERVLQAIALGDPKLDSAPKMWTYFGVAKSLDCATNERVSGWIAKWLYTPPNTNFIQNNPEVVYRIGLGIKAPHLTRDAFSMLAGEKALLNACYEDHPGVLSHVTQSIHGRTLELLDDDESNRIDHAATSLARRMRAKFDKLVEKEMKWLELSDEYRKIFKLKPEVEKDKAEVDFLVQKIKDYVRGRLLWTLSRNIANDFHDFDTNLDSAKDFRSGLPYYFGETYERLNDRQRLLTRTFWFALGYEKIQDGDSNIYTPSSVTKGTTKNQYFWDESSIARQMYKREVEAPGTGLIRVTVKDLMICVRAFNQIGSRYHTEEQKVIQDQQNIATLNFHVPVEDFLPESGSHDFNGSDGAFTLWRDGNQTDALNNETLEDDCLFMSPQKRNLRPDMSLYPSKDKRRRLSETPQSHLEIDQPFFTAKLPLRPMNPDESDPTCPDVRMADEKHGPVLFEDAENGARLDVGDDDGEQDLADFAAAHNLKLQGPPHHSLLGQAPLPLDNRLHGLMARNYDAYARNIAEEINSSFWRDSNGDIYLRLLPDMQIGPYWHVQTSANGAKWYLAPDPFKPEETTNITSPNGNTAQYWRSPTGDLWRRSSNAVSYIPQQASTKPPSLEASRADDLPGIRRRHVEKSHVKFEPVPEAIKYWRTDKQKQRTLTPGLPKLSTPRKPPMFDFDIDTPTIANAGSLQETKPRYSIQDTNRHPCIRLDVMLEQFTGIINRSTEEVLYPSHMYHCEDMIPRDLMDTVMCLNDEEWKYLPLWAGGNDDGTGGVFDDVDVPNLEAGGFRGGKRGLGGGRVDDAFGVTSEGSMSSFDDVASEAVSTVGRASKNATDGTRTVRSVSEAGESESADFMRQDELWDEIRTMKVNEEGKGIRQEAAKKNSDDDDEDDDGDVSTVMGAGSDAQGDMFYDIDDDEDDHEEKDDDGGGDGDSDMEIIDMEQL